jgi:hypothetical protein
MNKPITIWYVRNEKTGCYCHNHIEDGHYEDTPVPKSEQQEVWNDYRWMIEHAWLDENNQVVYEP